jgi:carboxyl-terminal processing protease
VISDAMLEEIKILAGSSKIKFNTNEFTRSKEFIKLQIKANIARHIWQRNMKNGLNNEFYQIVFSQDPIVTTAIKQFNKAEKLEKEKKL